jgi:hypothetical protein
VLAEIRVLTVILDVRLSETAWDSGRQRFFGKTRRLRLGETARLELLGERLELLLDLGLLGLEVDDVLIRDTVQNWSNGHIH